MRQVDTSNDDTPQADGNASHNESASHAVSSPARDISASCDAQAHLSTSESDSMNVDPPANSSRNDNHSDSLEDTLKKWAFKHKITHAALRDLLTGLISHGHQNLPKDPRTLLQTPRSAKIVPMGSGEFCSFNLKDIICQQIEKFNISSSDLKLTLNVDGLPIFKSSSFSLWLLCGYLDETEQSPFIISVYGGASKPEDANEFMRPFVNDMIDIQNNGILVKNVSFNVTIKNVIFDSPARSFITYTKGHTGYFACSKCVTRGSYTNNKIIFPQINAELRTDSSFSNKTNSEYHNGVSILEELQVGMISQVPLDYLHVVCLGVIKRLLFIWIDGPVPYKLSASIINDISTRIKYLVQYVPSDFDRKPRKLNEYKRWKGTEFRFFAVYISVVVLHDLIDKDRMLFMSLLFIALRILLRRSPPADIKYADDLLKYCVEHFGELFGISQITYNVHNLIHLSKNVLDNGPLDNTSAFPFENFMSSVKKMVRKPNCVLAQIYNRCSELNEYNNHYNKLDEARLYKKIGDKYYRCTINNVVYSNLLNNCGAILKNKTFIKILYFDKHNNMNNVHYNRLLPKQHIFEPHLMYTETQQYGIYPCYINQEIEMCDISNISGKTCLFPLFHKPDTMVSIPLLNTI